MKKTYLLIWVILILGMFYVVPTQAESELTQYDLESSFVQEANTVDMHLSKFAAVEYAKKFYGKDYDKLYFYDLTTYYDLDDHPSVFAFTLTSIKDGRPTIEDLKVQQKDKYDAIKRLKNFLSAIQLEPVSGKTKSVLSSGLRKQIKQLEKELRQNDRFVTILCGATEQHVPVIRAYQGLPTHLTLLPRIQDKVASTADIENLKPCRVYSLGVFDQLFSLEISHNEGDGFEVGSVMVSSDTKLIDFRRAKVNSKAEIRSIIDEKKAIRIADEQKQTLEDQELITIQKEDRKDRIRKKWQRLKALYQQREREYMEDNSEHNGPEGENRTENKMDISVLASTHNNEKEGNDVK